MRTYIFTQHEESILKAYLKHGEKPDLFYDLVSRMRKHRQRISEHYALMVKVLEKFEAE